MGRTEPTLWELIREDVATHNRMWCSPGLHAVVVHRLGREVSEAPRARRSRFLRPVFRVGRVLVRNLYGIELPPEATIGRRVHLPHGQGVVVVPGAVIGDDVMLRHNVTLGTGSVAGGGFPVVGNRVQFGPGAMVIGGVTVGDDVLVGPGALVLEDVPAGWRAVAQVATVRPPKGQLVDMTGAEPRRGGEARSGATAHEPVAEGLSRPA